MILPGSEAGVALEQAAEMRITEPNVSGYLLHVQ